VNHGQLRAAQSKRWEAIERKLATTDGWVLIEDNYLMARAPIEPYVLNPANFANLEGRSRFVSERLWRRITGREFSLIVARYPLTTKVRQRPFSESWIERMLKTYRLVETWPRTDRESFYVYRPVIQELAQCIVCPEKRNH
jgi:hypothetical protein